MGVSPKPGLPNEILLKNRKEKEEGEGKGGDKGREGEGKREEKGEREEESFDGGRNDIQMES